jgi:valyl-tRNA synthetase
MLTKEQKKQQKLEKFLAKKTSAISITKAPREYRGSGYDPLAIEERWCRHWEENELFRPREGRRKFVVPIPPPNVTGSLHIGHAMMVAIQDSICRYKRMSGYEVLYIPGTDHAGIATQSVVAKQLAKENIKVDREGFLEKTWEWKNKHGSRIYEQLKRLGTSVDFSRERFTMDPIMSEAVIEAFVRLHEKGLIYRESKIVNWCAKLSTTLSDLEVDNEEVRPNTYIEADGGRYEFGVLYYFRYPITSDEEYSGSLRDLPSIEVATTRPETILGDTAVCVNPRDGRFNEEGLARLFNKPVRRAYAVNPLTRAVIPIISDEQADMSFGSGALKVTPAHDPNDFELCRRHKLECKIVLDAENRISVDGEFKGLKRYDARKKVVDRLAELGLFVEKKGYAQVIPRCSRSSDIIEPMLKSQWWMSCRDMPRRAIEAARTKRIEILPEEGEKQWYRWLENIRDWCLSRQLWWGHRVPAYRVPSGEWTIGRTKEEAMEKYLASHGECVYGPEDFEQDEDVLDTWFSSGLWPFATLGWPRETRDYQRYYPTTLLETGSDILFFWVARMVMLGIELTGREPFSTVLLHGIVRDAHGRKMSKSLGNVIDPIFVIDGCSLDGLIRTMKDGNLDAKEMSRAESVLKTDFPTGIPRCGADALRFTLLSYTSGMNDINLDVLRVEGYRRLCNKIWNAQKFVKGMVETSSLRPVAQMGTEELRNVSAGNLIHWILEGRNKTAEAVSLSLETFNFMAATQAIHQFFLYDLCDVFIEAVKGSRTELSISVLLTVFLDCMKMFHPFMPFITEEVYSNYCDHSISTSGFPMADGSEHSNSFAPFLNLVKQSRALVDRHNIAKCVLEIVPGEELDKDDLAHLPSLCKRVAEVRVVGGTACPIAEEIGGSRVGIFPLDSD